MAVPSSPLIIIVLPILILVSVLVRHHSRKKLQQPPLLSETVPYVSNAWQFMTNKRLFINRVREALRESPVVRCRLGPLTLHLVPGGSSVSAIFRSSFTSDPWILRILEHTAGYSSPDLAKFIADESGCATLPRLSSSGPVAPDKRIWYAMHRTREEGLVSARSVAAFSTSFQEFLGHQLSEFRTAEWVEVRIFDFLKKHMSIAATLSVLGSRILDINPGFIEAFWQYEQFGSGFAACVASGMSWLNKNLIRILPSYPTIQTRSPFLGRDYQGAWLVGGSLFGFSVESLGAAYALLLFGLHANTITICTWMMMEVIKDLDLYRAIKEEISRVKITDGPLAGSLEPHKLASFPLLQSVYTESLRLHVSILVTRTSTQPVTISGYNIPKGSVFQAPTEVGHLDEAVWSTPDHPASEFWAYRHVKEVERTDDMGNVAKGLEFSIGTRSGSYFPFGGGISICAGRNFAKAEVLLAMAMIISEFDVEFIEWVKLDGSCSDRPALDNGGYADAVAAPPDRDIEIRWRKTF
ncbi:putative Cytochrome P450 [Seiridium cardinale]